jgi:hypothetical protein
MQAVTDLFLDAVKAKKSLTQTLVDTSLLEETDTTEGLL